MTLNIVSCPCGRDALRPSTRKTQNEMFESCLWLTSLSHISLLDMVIQQRKVPGHTS